MSGVFFAQFGTAGHQILGPIGARLGALVLNEKEIGTCLQIQLLLHRVQLGHAFFTHNALRRPGYVNAVNQGRTTEVGIEQTAYGAEFVQAYQQRQIFNAVFHHDAHHITAFYALVLEIMRETISQRIELKPSHLLAFENNGTGVGVVLSIGFNPRAKAVRDLSRSRSHTFF